MTLWAARWCKLVETSKFSQLLHQEIACRFINPLNAELNPMCYLLALLLAHHFLHVSRIRVKSLMSYIYIYIYMEHLFLMFLDHTQRRTTVGRTPLERAAAGRSPAEMVGSNPTGGMDICLL